MKFMLPLLFALLAVPGCKGRESTLTEFQKAQVTEEVLAAMKPLAEAFARVDIEAALRMCHRSPDFGLVMPEGKALGFEELRALGKEMAGGLQKQTFTPAREKVIVVSPDAALYCWQGRIDLLQKDGAILRSDPYSLTYLIRKVEGRWSFAYGHESGVPYQVVKQPG
ncbi:MAG: nuclear transport factor 2 family protein [Acidobacteria bacterium]|nr:nuclear transport factor 2 family protein [Acidobacteriota bacterium]